MRPICFVFVCLFCACLLFSAPVRAFFPSVDEVQNRIDGKTVAPKSYQAVVSFPEYEDIRVFIWSSGQSFRQEWAVSEGDKNRVLAAAVGRGSRITRCCPVNATVFVLPLVSYWLPAGRMDSWKGMGIDPQAMSYRFDQDRPCLVLGANATVRGASQVWLDNETYAPVRLIWARPSGTVEVAWKNFNNHGGYSLPEAGTVTGCGEQLDFTVDWRGVNITIPDKIFSAKTFADKFKGGCAYPLAQPVDILSECLGVPAR